MSRQNAKGGSSKDLQNSVTFERIDLVKTKHPDERQQTLMARNRQNTDAGKARAEAVFKKKELQLREGEKALAEYHAQGQATRDNTARLRAARLANEVATQEGGDESGRKLKPKGKAKRPSEDKPK
jgi:hypothetical protein